MKVFISWSGERSKAIAEALRDWLPSVIQSVRPWLSLADIDKGTRWRAEIAEQLEQCRIGIICLTPENLSSHWLLFEAGALSKIQGQSYVCTFLHELAPTDVRDPLAQFQHTVAAKEDIKNLVMTINRAQGEHANPEAQVERVFEWGWPELKEKLTATPKLSKPAQHERSEREMLQELLEFARSEARERAKNRRLADNFLISFLPIIEAALLSDPKVRLTPEMTNALSQLKHNANSLSPSLLRWLEIYQLSHNLENVEPRAPWEESAPPNAWIEATAPNAWTEVARERLHELQDELNQNITLMTTPTSSNESSKKTSTKSGGSNK